MSAQATEVATRDVNSEPTRLTREELYELVWSEPMRTLAPRFGLSDAGLAKICRRHKIPRPYRGYWQRKRHGKSARRTPLKPLKHGEEERLGTITLGPRNDRRVVEEATGPVAEQKRYEAEHPIVVPERMGRAHPLVKATREYFRNVGRGRWSYAERQVVKRLDLNVDDKSLPRALRIMNALIRALEKRGFPVTVESVREEQRTLVTVHGTKLKIGIKEHRKQVKIPPSPEELTRTRGLPWHGEPRIELEYTGELALAIDEFWARGVRKTWADGKKQRVEESLNAFVVGLVRAAEVKKEHLRQREEEERRREEERQRWLEEERRRRELALRGKRLERLAAVWARAGEVRRFVAAARGVAEQGGALQEASELSEWLAWAEAYAEELDPLAMELTELPNAGAAPEDERPARLYQNLW